MFDRDSDVHHNLLSGLQKSIRGSDPDGAVFYLARLLEGGDIISACRRLQVIASEDIGLAYPQAAQITYALCQSARELGLPEARIPLSAVVIEMALSPKSNTAHIALDIALEDIEKGNVGSIPNHIRPDSPDYKYPHDYKGAYVQQQYLPDKLKNKKYYVPKDIGYEKTIKEIYDRLEKLKNGQNKK